MNKPTVGQTVYLKSCGNQARYQGETVTEATVTKAGHKYFSAVIQGRVMAIEFHIESGRQKTQYTADWVAYESHQQISDEIETDKICSDLRAFFRDYSKPERLLLETLRKILELTKQPQP